MSTLLTLLLIHAIAPSHLVRQSDEVGIEAWSHYERIYSDLVADRFDHIQSEAAALAAPISALAGREGTDIAQKLAQSGTLNEAREHFEVLAEILLKHVDRLPGPVHVFICPMNHKRWVQTKTVVANPYFGRVMSTCGTEQRR